jgi:DNA-binding SARP family transcriptional activator
MLSLRTLGGIRLSDASGELLAGRRKDLVVLAYLAMRSPRPVRRDELVGLFWDERDQRHALQSLRQVLVRLRRTVGEGLTVDRELVRLGEDSVRVDARAFAATSLRGWP